MKSRYLLLVGLIFICGMGAYYAYLNLISSSANSSTGIETSQSTNTQPYYTSNPNVQTVLLGEGSLPFFYLGLSPQSSEIIGILNFPKEGYDLYVCNGSTFLSYGGGHLKPNNGINLVMWRVVNLNSSGISLLSQSIINYQIKEQRPRVQFSLVVGQSISGEGYNFAGVVYCGLFPNFKNEKIGIVRITSQGPQIVTVYCEIGTTIALNQPFDTYTVTSMDENSITLTPK